MMGCATINRCTEYIITFELLFPNRRFFSIVLILPEGIFSFQKKKTEGNFEDEHLTSFFLEPENALPFHQTQYKHQSLQQKKIQQKAKKTKRKTEQHPETRKTKPASFLMIVTRENEGVITQSRGHISS